MAGMKRGGEAQDILPMRADDVGLDTLAEQGLEARIGGRVRDRDEPPIGEVAQARVEAEAEKRAKREDMIGRPTRVGVVLLDGIAKLFGSSERDMGFG